jgi:hypothetical protein
MQNRRPYRTVLKMEPDAFGDCCLPHAMEFARAARTKIEPQLHNIPEEWPFEDRVLVWLWPNLQKDVKAFHEQNGKKMDQIFQSQHLEHFDEILLRDLLIKVPAYRSGRRVRSLRWEP